MNLRRIVKETIRARILEADAGQLARRLLVQTKNLRRELISNDTLYAFEGYEFDEREMASDLGNVISKLEEYVEFASLHRD